MANCLQFLRVGLINILGITVPGILLLLFLSAGLIFPLAICVVPLCQRLVGSDACVTWELVATLSTSDKVLVVSLIVVLAYIAGYIIRLSTPDDLDRISAKIVLAKMSEEAKRKEGLAAREDHWPYQGEPDNKFPYFHFRDYLLSRGLEELATLVSWGPSGRTDQSKRSKTRVNMMKLELAAMAPELSAIIESNEAHVRLMFGVWFAIMTTRYLVVFGAILSIVGLAVADCASPAFESSTSPPYGLSLLISAVLLVGMWWAKARIEHLFHYQRVRELFYIVACLHFARAGKPVTALPTGSARP